MRFTLVTAIILGLALTGGSTAVSASARTPSISVSFSGTATGRFVDIERWVLLSSNECYLRHLRDQKTVLSWSVGFAGSRSLSIVSPATVEGVISGSEIRDSCDEVAEELPPDAAADWLRRITCSDPVAMTRPARAAWENGTLRLSAPVTGVAKGASCTAIPRSTELNVRIALSSSRITKLKRGGQLQFAVGTARPTTGTYRPRVNCQHPAKPYDGYRSYDSCVDTLTWSGMVTITRL